MLLNEQRIRLRLSKIAEDDLRQLLLSYVRFLSRGST